MEKATRRTAYASKQLQAGPAPLASFEDLPSDELESPEDFVVEKFDLSSTDSDREFSFARKQSYDESHGFHLCSTTPDTFLSAASTPQIESDFDSQFTLTPGEPCKGDSTSELRGGSLMSLSKEDQLSIKQKKGSALSLGASEVSETSYSQRKSSWTDIFRAPNTNISKSGTLQVPNQDTSTSHKGISKKKTKGDHHKKDQIETKPKEKGKFLSMFKVGKKSNKNASSPVSPDAFILPNATPKVFSDHLQSTYVSELDSKNSLPAYACNIHNAEGKENELPKEIELYSVHKEECFQVNSNLEKTDKKTCRSSEDVWQSNTNGNGDTVGGKVYDVLPAQIEVDPAETGVKRESNSFASILSDDHESSESELAFDIKDSCAIKKDDEDDDYEAEKLLAQDSSEIEEYSTPELQPMILESYKSVMKTSRQQRLEVTTIPIERPRSTTPINIAPLEAFIQSVSPSSDSKVDKIKLSLPGDQFIKLKSPKKNSTKSWTDFCEEGLHSPRTPKRAEGDEGEAQIKPPCHPSKHFSDQMFPNAFDDKAEFSESPWVTFESSWDQNLKSGVRSHMESGFPSASCYEMPQVPKAHHYHDSSLERCACECHIYGCENCITPDEMSIGDNVAIPSTFPTDSVLADDHILSEQCACACHRKCTTAVISSPPEAKDENESNIDSFNSFDIGSGLAVHSLKDQDF